MKIRNKVDTRIESWVIPALMYKDLEYWTFNTTFILWFDIKRLNQKSTRNIIAIQLVKKTNLRYPVKRIRNI